VPHGPLAIGTQLLGQQPTRAIPESGYPWDEHVPPPGRDATLLAVVPIPGTQTSLAIVGYAISTSSGSGSGSGSGSAVDTVTVNRPAALIAGVQTITGTESDPSQSIFLDWRGFGTPVIGDSDWVQATVTSSGSFSAAMTIDHAGAQGTMFYRIGSGSTIAAWSGTPS